MNPIRFLAVAFGVLVGCGVNPVLVADPADASLAEVAVAPRCTGGVTVSCGCFGLGMVGVQRCDPGTGLFGDCACPGTDSGADAPAADAPGDAPLADAVDAATLPDSAPAASDAQAAPDVPVASDVPAPVDVAVDAAGSCRPGTTWCGDANGCRSLDTDPNHCGWCGNRLGSLLPDSQHRVLTCRNGGAVRVCEPGWCVGEWASAEPPDGGVDRGCLVSVVTGLATGPVGLNRFVIHCGACGRQCAAPLGAYSTCTSGQCGWACVQGRADCNRDPADGCEVLTEQNQFNCGACGRQCAMNERCVTGTCRAI